MGYDARYMGKDADGNPIVEKYGGSLGEANAVKMENGKNVEETVNELNNNLNKLGGYEQVGTIPKGASSASVALSDRLSNYKFLIIEKNMSSTSYKPIFIPIKRFMGFNGSMKYEIFDNTYITYVDDTHILATSDQLCVVGAI